MFVTTEFNSVSPELTENLIFESSLALHKTVKEIYCSAFIWDLAL